MSSGFGAVERDPTGAYRMAPENYGGEENANLNTEGAEVVNLNTEDDSFYGEMLSLFRSIRSANPGTTSPEEVLRMTRSLKDYIRKLDRRVYLGDALFKELNQIMTYPSAKIKLDDLVAIADKYEEPLRKRGAKASRNTMRRMGPLLGGGRRRTHRRRANQKLKGRSRRSRR